MNYPFPTIRTIDDVLPHIAGRDEFNVNDKGDYITINYAVAFEDTFPPVKVAGGSAKMRAERALTNAIRRECRGIKFYPNGEIAARLLHKFFNIGEREETLPNRLDFGANHSVLTKADGSMLHPILIHDQIRWCTKAGITDVSEKAEVFIDRVPRYRNFAAACIERGWTPIFEYVGPYNKVVIDYPEENMVLLAVRENITGTYLNIGA